MVKFGLCYGARTVAAAPQSWAVGQPILTFVYLT